MCGLWHRQWEKGHFQYNFDVRKGRIFTSWFGGAKTNIAYNCLDRHIKEVKPAAKRFPKDKK